MLARFAGWATLVPPYADARAIGAAVVGVVFGVGSARRGSRSGRGPPARVTPDLSREGERGREAGNRCPDVPMRASEVNDEEAEGGS